MSLCRMSVLGWRPSCPLHPPTVCVCMCVQVCGQRCAKGSFAGVSVFVRENAGWVHLIVTVCMCLCASILCV